MVRIKFSVVFTGSLAIATIAPVLALPMQTPSQQGHNVDHPGNPYASGSSSRGPDPPTGTWPPTGRGPLGLVSEPPKSVVPV